MLYTPTLLLWPAANKADKMFPATEIAIIVHQNFNFHAPKVLGLPMDYGQKKKKGFFFYQSLRRKVRLNRLIGTFFFRE
jgi:hypothetical protein